MSRAINTVAAALGAFTMTVYLLLGGNHALIESDTKAKLRLAERAIAELNARRASKYAEVLAACLNGGRIVEGRRIIACRETR